MIRSLRKGQSSIYLQHEITGHTIGAERFESDVADGVAILRLRLRPVDGNQRSDEQYLATNPLLSISISDSTVVTGFINHVNSRRQDVSSWRLQIVSRGREHAFLVEPSVESHGALQVLQLQVVAGGSSQETPPK